MAFAHTAAVNTRLAHRGIPAGGQVARTLTGWRNCGGDAALRGLAGWGALMASVVYDTVAEAAWG